MFFKQKKRKIYCFVGLPGSGKGTQIDILAKEKDATVIGIGKIAREAIDGKFDLDKSLVEEIRKNYDIGEPQEDEIVFKLIKSKLGRAKHKNLIFDNFPFSKHQAKLLDEFVIENKFEKPIVIYINILPKTAIERLKIRKLCSKCGATTSDTVLDICPKCGGKLENREDDNTKTVENRIRFYTPRIKEILELYPNHFNIDGEGSIENIAQNIKKSLNEK